MKKWLLFLIPILILASCGQTTTDHKKNATANKPTSDDVTVRYRSIEHIERLDQFMKNMQDGKPDNVRLIRFTTEGDPIYQLLNYDGKTLLYTLDTTRDKFSNNENRKKTTYKCQNINRQETNTFTDYSLEGCPTQQNDDLLIINHDIKKEDYFAFKLSVGKNNVIDTNHRELSKALSNGNTVTVKDFQLPDHVMNDIYKAMILSNYLQEKHFSSQCQSQSAADYELNVWINSGKRQFKWKACDQTPDGKVMTHLAKTIITIVESTPEYKNIVE